MNKLKKAEERQREVQVRINSMEKVMHNLDVKGMFGRGKQRLDIVITHTSHTQKWDKCCKINTLAA